MPIGGLSSSVAVLIAYTMALAKASNIELKPFEVVKTASEAERDYIGINNGLPKQAHFDHVKGRVHAHHDSFP